MCEERLRFIISVRNMDKHTPDYYYLCGARAPVRILSACTSRNEVLLDTDPGCALVLQSLDAAAYNYGLLKDLGFEGIQILQKITTFENMDSTAFDDMVTQSKIKSILDCICTEDIEYLQSKGVLDLTIVT